MVSLMLLGMIEEPDAKPEENTDESLYLDIVKELDQDDWSLSDYD